MVDDDDNFNNREFIVDEMLGDVLLMQRETIQSHFQEVKQMKSDIRSLEEKIRIGKGNKEVGIPRLKQDGGLRFERDFEMSS